MTETKDPPFVVQPTADGQGWRVLCVVGYGPSIDIGEHFLTEAKAQHWIDSRSKSWLEKQKAGND
jgi:hypothetical protein